MGSVKTFLKKNKEQIRFMIGYYFTCFIMGLIIWGLYEWLNKEEKPTTDEQVAACLYSSFKLNDESRIVCCKKAFVTTCGLTVAFCEGKIPMFLCQEHSSCLSGPSCDTLPEWIKDNAANL